MIQLASVFRGVAGFAGAALRPVKVSDLVERTANEFNLFYGNLIAERDRWHQMASRVVLMLPMAFIIGFCTAHFWPVSEKIDRYAVPVNSRGVPVGAAVPLDQQHKFVVTSDAITDVAETWIKYAMTVTPDTTVEEGLLLPYVNTHTDGAAVAAINQYYQKIFSGDGKGTPDHKGFVREITGIRWNEIVKDRSYVFFWHETDKRFDGTVFDQRSNSATLTMGVVQDNGKDGKSSAKRVEGNGAGIYVVGFMQGGGAQ